MKKLMACVISLAMMASLSMAAFAADQTVSSEGDVTIPGTGTITATALIKTALQTVVTAAATYNLADGADYYTDATWGAFQTSLTAANTALTDATTQTEIDNAKTDLEAKLTALATKPISVTVPTTFAWSVTETTAGGKTGNITSASHSVSNASTGAKVKATFTSFAAGSATPALTGTLLLNLTCGSNTLNLIGGTAPSAGAAVVDALAASGSTSFTFGGSYTVTDTFPTTSVTGQSLVLNFGFAATLPAAYVATP